VPAPDDLSFLLFRQSNVISRRQALRWFTSSAIRNRVQRGRWQVAHRGVYLAEGGTHVNPAADQRRWIASLSAGCGRPMPLGGLSALAVLGMRGFAETEVHVMVPPSVQRRRPPIFAVVHRTASLRQEHIHWTCTPPCVKASRAVVDAARWAGFADRARAVIAAAFQQRLIEGDEIDVVLAAMPRIHRRGLIEEAVIDARGGAHSLPEARFLRLCRDARLPRPACQVRRLDSSGRRRYLDACFEEWQVHVEIDGGHHMDVRQWWADMKRQNDLWIPGGRVLRFPAWAVRERPAEVAAQVEAALLAAGWRRL
jgi:very-short-patch-repair endonuclease